MSRSNGDYNDDDDGEVLWVKDISGAYLAARLVNENDDGTAGFIEYETGRKVESTLESIVGSVAPPYNQTLKEFKDDLVEAADISEPSILWQLAKKFNSNDIYSSIGTNSFSHVVSLFLSCMSLCIYYLFSRCVVRIHRILRRALTHLLTLSSHCK